MSSFKKKFSQNHASLLGMLICLTTLFLATQLAFFAIHYQLNDILDSLVKNSLSANFHLSLFFPILASIFIQLFSYILLITWLWFISTSCGQLFKLSSLTVYLFGILLWVITITTILMANAYYYQDSFFARFISSNSFFMCCAVILLAGLTILSFYNVVKHKKNKLLGSLLLIIFLTFLFAALYQTWEQRTRSLQNHSQPNVILIGIDSLRPDFVHYFGNKTIHTPNIDSFLSSATIFTNAYTPLARTFPAWMSILTAKYPKHSHARNNLVDPALIATNDTLAKHFQQAGYETIYATDEKRFSNITERYGFDRIIGPRMGVNDFILGSLSDFPLTNLLINSSLGQLLFPYNFGNRAAAITYEPDKFMQQVKAGLIQRSNKPLFFAVHFCVSHWPFTWARDQQTDDFTMAQRYQSSIEIADKQLGELMVYLQKNHLLDHSLVVLLSDHGTTLGLSGDRIISKKHYRGDSDKLKWMSVISTGNNKFYRDFDISFGQGTDVLSLKQSHVVLAYRGFGVNTVARSFGEKSSLLDITPTILDFLKLPLLQNVDGVSFSPVLSGQFMPSLERSLWLETGYKIAEIETNQIDTNQVLQKSIGIYRIDQNGLVSVKPAAEHAIVKVKQRAVMVGDWILAYFPANTVSKLVPKPHSTDIELKPYTFPAYFVVANTKTGLWTIGLNTAFAKTAPVAELEKKFFEFYGDEVLMTGKEKM